MPSLQALLNITRKDGNYTIGTHFEKSQTEKKQQESFFQMTDFAAGSSSPALVMRSGDCESGVMETTRFL